MKSDDGGGIGEGELVEGFDDRKEGLREHDHAGIIDGAEDFLELRHGSDEEKAGMFQEFGGAFGEEIDGIAGEEKGF